MYRHNQPTKSSLFANSALLSDGWADNVRLEITAGKISALTVSATKQPDDICVDRLLPALANLHSHSFQRAMAGMTEYRATKQDNFWSWRDLMYRFVDQITPDQVEAFASLAFMEMQEAGYASVGEFHYLHHQTGGQQFDNPVEMSNRIFAAAASTGIGLTHLPVLYSYGGAGKKPLSGGQSRFGNDVSQFTRLVSDIFDSANNLPADTRVGIAPHSLRATCPEDLTICLDDFQRGPIHMHIAEQQKEITEIQTWLGCRPVEWLFDNAPVDEKWCLVHATHMTTAETAAVARSGAVAGLCPVTEANLGDGVFNAVDFLENRGVFGIGTDSNIQISMAQELRQLEYSQRLSTLSRNVMVDASASVGQSLYMSAAIGGAQALSRDCGAIKLGALADLVAIDGTVPSLYALNDDQFLDGVVFAAPDNIVTDLWSAGRHCVQSGQHIAHDQIIANYRTSIADLLDSL